jgi:hypothetical protein
MEPSAKQRMFTEAIGRGEWLTLIYSAGARAGKSDAADLGLLWFFGRWPKSRWLVGRWNYSDLQESTFVSLGTMIGRAFGRGYTHVEQIEKDIGVWRAGLQKLTFTTGGEIVFRHFKDAGALGSTEYHGIYLEEPQEIPSEEALGVDGVYAMLGSRLNRVARSERWGESVPQMWMTEMPWGETWVKWLRVGDADRGIEALMRCLVIHGDYRDNLANLPREWVVRMEAMPEAVRRRYLEGSDESTTGLLYAVGDDQLVEVGEVPWGWPVTVAFDYGIDTGAWLWIARVCGGRGEMRDGDLLVVEEMDPAGMVVDEQVKQEAERRGRYRVVQSVIDPHANTRTHAGDRFIRLSDLFSERGVHFAPGSSDKMAGIAVIADWLKRRKLWVSRACPRLVKDLRTCTLENIDEKHFHAALRYGMLARPQEARVLEVAGPKPTGLAGRLAGKMDRMDRKGGRTAWVRGTGL